MFDEGFIRNFTRQIHGLWIGPELEKRREAGRLPEGFLIGACLIRLPPGLPPVVEFNREISLRAWVKLSEGTAVRAGDAVYLWDVQQVESVEPPTHDGKRVAFVYLHRVNDEWQVFFDLSPNNPEITAEQEGKSWSFAEPLAVTLQQTMFEMAVHLHDTLQPQLVKIGLWAAPALLPYPLNRIASLVKNGDEDGARRVLIEHCKSDRLVAMTEKWWDAKPFTDRRPLIEQSLAAHKAGQYFLTVSTLLPHLEGVMTDWVEAKSPGAPFRQESKTKRFRELATTNPGHSHVYRRVVDSALDFILSGPVLATFKQWFDSFETTFANRHVVGHGRFEQQVYTEENSIKLFLMLDTIYQIIAADTAKGAEATKPGAGTDAA